ncbi:lipoprotein insertase outer membrane protein LolB [Dokdonella sp. MW10]|uniref:lipoprotein insertase outer membrane protein LolB n=1 Tax=Dokdonella sp. MW10 TaxID=2992926 RepID=UPI003F7CF997
MTAGLRVRTAAAVFAITALVLAGCTPSRVKPDAAASGDLDTRERALAPQVAWTLSGRLAVSGRGDGGSGSLTWEQDGTRYRFAVNAPVTGKTWILSGDDGHAELTGLRATPVRGDDATRLLERELGWQVPVAQLAAWARAVRAPGAPATVAFRADGLPAQIDQAGWTVRYLDYDTSRDPALPTRIFASRGDDKVRLVVQRWSTP